jgi:hypothetical protein
MTSPKFTKTKNGLTLRWEPKPNDLAKPPKDAPDEITLQRDEKWATFELERLGAKRGPKGWLPALQLKPDTSKDFAIHLYAETVQQKDVQCYGQDGVLSVHSPHVSKNGGFSLAQTALVNAPGQAGGCHHTALDSSVGWQTLEAGWHVAYRQYGDYDPHLFTYYTTDGYADQQKDNIRGYNSIVSGWRQYSETVYPGESLSFFRVRDAQKPVLRIRYQLHNGNWWLFCNRDWIGYYPASLFNDARQDGLSKNANMLWFFGEVAAAREPAVFGTAGPWKDGKNHRYELYTMSAYGMGQGKVIRARDDWASAAYMRNLNQLDAKGKSLSYKGNKHRTAVDHPFDTKTHFNGKGPKGSWLQYGGMRDWGSLVMVTGGHTRILDNVGQDRDPEPDRARPGSSVIRQG